MTIAVARATVIERPEHLPAPRLGYRIVAGPYEGLTFCAYDRPTVGASVRVLFCPDDQFAKSVTAEHLGEATIMRLARLGIVAYWNHPGYLTVPFPGGSIVYGEDGGEWYGHIEDDNETVIGTLEDLPDDATPEDLAKHLADAHKRMTESEP